MKRASTTILVLLLALAKSALAQTDIYIGVTGKEYKRTGLALANFLPARPDEPKDLELAGRFREIIRADLMYSRYFDVKEDPAGSDALSADTDALKFWNVSGAGWLVTAKAAQNEKNWTFNARLYDQAP